jgi:hypothetical protein
MTGGSQERGAGLAALTALRRRRLFFGSRGTGRWEHYEQAIGQHLYRQLMYVMNYGSNRGQAHEIENVRIMLEMMLGADRLVRTCESSQAAQLRDVLTSYPDNAKPKPDDTPQARSAAQRALAEVQTSLSTWAVALDDYAKTRAAARRRPHPAAGTGTP